MKMNILYWKIKRKYLVLRHRNLGIGFGTVILGILSLHGSGRVSIGSNCRLVSPRITCDGEVDIGDNGYFHKTCLVAKQKIEIGSLASWAIVTSSIPISTTSINILYIRTLWTRRRQSRSGSATMSGLVTTPPYSRVQSSAITRSAAARPSFEVSYPQIALQLGVLHKLVGHL